MRYPIEDKDGNVSEAVYGINFTKRPYDPETNLWAKQMEEDPEYRRMIFQQMQEEGELAGRHAEERVRYIARKRRERQDSPDPYPGDRPEPTAVDLGRAIKILRVKRDWTQSKLSEVSGVSLPYISNIEKGQREASLKKLRQIAGAFGLAPADLWGLAGRDD